VSARQRTRSSRQRRDRLLIGTLGYAPLTRGLQAALPFVDDVLPARTLTDLTDLALHLNTLTRRG
jgi:hypothetical protein